MRQTDHRSCVQSPWCPLRKFISLRAGWARMGVSVEESCARGWPAFAGAEWHGKCLAGSQCQMSWKGVAQLVLATGLCSSAYLVHCIAYRGPLTCSPQLRQNDLAQLFTYSRLCEASWLATVVSLAHIGMVGTGDLRMVRGDYELTQGVNPGQKKGFGIVLCKLWNSSDGCHLFDHWPVGTRLHWSADSRPIWVGWDRMASVVGGRRSVAGELK